MRSLKDLMESGFFNSDISVIKAYLQQLEIISDVPDMLTELMRTQLEEYRRKQRKRDEMHFSEGFEHYFKNYPPEVASKFVLMYADIAAEEEFSDHMKEWIRTHVPTLKLVSPFYQEIVYRINKLGVRFSNQTDEDVQSLKNRFE